MSGSEKSAEKALARPTSGRSPQRSSRRRAREFVVQGLYQWRISGESRALEIESHLAAEADFARADRKLFQSLLGGVLRDQNVLIEVLSPHIDRPFNELSPVESCILLLAAFELTSHPETPYRVIINEAIELAKTFGGTDGHKYVNGVLDKLAANVRAAEITAKDR